MTRQEPVGWLDNVTLEGATEPVRVVLHERRGNEVLVRQADPGDGDLGRVALYEGDRIVVMTALSHVGVHTQPESEDNSDLVHSMRVVPVRREGNIVYARTLRHGEVDDGRRVHVAPGDRVTLEAGALVAELEAIDALEEETESGYKPLAPVLSAWFHFGREHWDDSAVRYLLAAARRLDMANELFLRVRQTEDEINVGGMPGPALRRKLFAVIGYAELAVISLGRALTMLETAPTRFGVALEVPSSIRSALPDITAIRNAYEHIEDRAFGTRFGVADPTALSIFDYARLAEDDLIVYGDYTLQITDQVDRLLRDGRIFLKQIAATALPRSSPGS